MMAKTVELIVRNPCLDEARNIEAPLEWTVLEVKQDVEKNWPEHPRPADQRMIYSGKLLDDGAKLKDVLRLDEGWTNHTIHLVCRQLSAKANAKASLKSDEGLRQRLVSNTPAPETPNANYWQAYIQAAQGQHASTDPQQIMMQQMYAHYFQQYMQYVNTSWNQGQSDTTAQQMPHQQLPMAAAAAAAAAMMGQQPINPHVAPQPQTIPQPAPEPAAAAAAAPPAGVAGGDGNLGNAVMNAGAGAMGAMEDDDEFEGGQRDLLDWIYVLSRVIVLFSIVYFYSSIARFALVMGLGLIFYLYRIGFFGNPHPAPPPAATVAAAAAAPPPEPAPANEEQNDNVDTADSTDDPSAPEIPLEIQQPWYVVASTFITTFFTSLLPNEPQVV